MRVDGTPLATTVRHAETGEEHEVLVANLVMDDAADNGLTTGWYWQLPDGRAPADPELWRDAVRAERGPCRNAQNALSAVGNWSRRAACMAARLEELAELVRSGEIDPGAQTASDYIERATEIDRRAFDARSNDDSAARDASDARGETEALDAGLSPAP